MYVILEITYFFKLNDLFEINDRKYLLSRHVYGHHKLKCCNIVMHGAIYGCSRMIRYLQCNNNNLAATVLRLFIGDISIHSLPSRVRANFGAKNIDVARFMLDCPEDSINRVSFIVGTFVHNQCIEGL